LVVSECLPRTARESSWLGKEGNTGDVAVNFAVAVDLKGLIEEALICGFIVVEGVRVLGPGAYFQLDAAFV
jgi:hypothetical protein